MRPRPQQVESLRSEAPAVGRNNRQKVRPRNGALFASAPGCRFGERAGSLVGARPPSLFSVLHHYMFRNWQPISADGGSPDTRERDHSNLKERQSLLLLLIIISSNDDDNLYSAISACSLYREQNIQHVFSLSPPPRSNQRKQPIEGGGLVKREVYILGSFRVPWAKGILEIS